MRLEWFKSFKDGDIPIKDTFITIYLYGVYDVGIILPQHVCSVIWGDGDNPLPLSLHKVHGEASLVDLTKTVHISSVVRIRLVVAVFLVFIWDMILILLYMKRWIVIYLDEDELSLSTTWEWTSFVGR